MGVVISTASRSRRSIGWEKPFGVKDKRAVGGFIEALFAIIIVSSGIVILTLSLQMISQEGEEPLSLEEEGERILISILTGECSEGDGWVIRNSSKNFDWEVPEADVNGFKVAIEEFDPHRIITVIEGGDPYRQGERCCRSMPVNVEYSPVEVRIALLRVWVW